MKIELIGAELSEIPSVNELVNTFSDRSSISSFISACRRELIQSGFMMGEVLIDGARVDNQKEIEIGGTPISKFESIKVEVAPTNIFVGETFKECVQASSRLLTLLEEISSEVRAGSNNKVAEDLVRFTDGLAVLTSAYQDGLFLLERLGVVQLEEIERSQTRLEGLKGVLEEVLKGSELQDLVLVSDALEYELPDQLKELSKDFSYWVDHLGVAGVEASSETVEKVVNYQNRLVSEME